MRLSQPWTWGSTLKSRGLVTLSRRKAEGVERQIVFVACIQKQGEGRRWLVSRLILSEAHVLGILEQNERGWARMEQAVAEQLIALNRRRPSKEAK